MFAEGEDAGLGCFLYISMQYYFAVKCTAACVDDWNNQSSKRLIKDICQINRLNYGIN